jgi:dUTP diphosphatase
MLQIPTKLKRYVSFTEPDFQAEPPRQMRDGDAGYDLVSAETIQLAPGERYAVRTGVRLAIPDGYAGLILPRSGMALHDGVTVLNAPGLIDSNYRGEIQVVLAHLGLKTESWQGGGDAATPDGHWHQHNIEPFVHINKGDRIAQLVITKVERAEFIPVSLLDPTNREQAGFGSSGV